MYILNFILLIVFLKNMAFVDFYKLKIVKIFSVKICFESLKNKKFKNSNVAI